MEEGQLWEAAMFAAHHRLSDLTAVVDVNGSQVDGPITSVTTVEPVTDKWQAFGWHVAEIDGHDVQALRAGFRDAAADSRPSVILARTNIRGRLTCIPEVADGHFLKLDGGLRKAIRNELLAPTKEDHDVQPAV